jgi:hypothetical protein
MPEAAPRLFTTGCAGEEERRMGAREVDEEERRMGAREVGEAAAVCALLGGCAWSRWCECALAERAERS